MRHLTDTQLAEILNQDIFRRIGRLADSLSLPCYVVGGYVRDLFLERPSKDIDIVVVGSGIALASALKKDLGKHARLSVFKNFGTAQVKAERLEIEFVGARKESYSHDSRKPVVEDGTLEDDQIRRDFTINALAISLNGDSFGHLIDPFDGLADMQDGLMVTPADPDVTFSDDPLRMLRCIRFATQLKFFIEDETFEAICRNAERIKIISGERISEELNKIMLADQPSRGFIDLHRSGLLAIILPELVALDHVETRNGKSHKNNFYHTLEVLDNLAANSKDLWLRWGALLHDVGKAKTKRWDNAVGWTFHNHNYIGAKMVAEIFKRLKMPLDAKMKYTKKMVDLHMRPIVIADEEVTDSAVRRLLSDAGEEIDDLMMLCEADITSKNQKRRQQFLDNFKSVRNKLEILKAKDYRRLFQPCVDGNEIMTRYGLNPCAEVGRLKQCLKDAVLDNKVANDRESLLRLLDHKAESMGLKPVVTD